MSPLPRRDRFGEYARKGGHLALRQIAAAPDQRIARRLAAQARSRQAEPRAGMPRVAILTPRSWTSHVQVEGMIAEALRLRGADVRFITCGGGLDICDRANVWESPPMPCRSCTRYVDASVDAHGFERVPLRQGWEANDPGPWPELDELSAAELLDVVDGELPLGRLVDIPSKWFLMGSQLGDDPLGPITVRRFLASARRVRRGLTDALDSIKPDTVLLLNGLFFFEAICWALCRERNIDVVTYERSFIKDTLLFRRGTPASRLDMDAAWARWRDVPLSQAEEGELDAYLEARRLGQRTIDRYWRDARFEGPGRTGHGRLVTLFTNVTWDSAVIGRELAFPRIQDWLAAAVEAFAARPEHELIIRVHPAELKLPGKRTREPVAEFLRSRFPVLPPNVRVIGPEDSTSSYSIMAETDVGLVFTSTTGLELALAGKPVVVAAQTHYRGKGFTLDAESPSDFLSTIDRALADPAAVRPDRDLSRRYAYLFFFRAPVAAPGVEEHVLGLARTTVRDIEELAPGRNAAMDRICEGILDGGDFTPDPR